MTDYTRLTSNKLIEVPQLKPEGPWANDSFGFKDYYIKGKKRLCRPSTAPGC